jgi:hypothetical protein
MHVGESFVATDMGGEVHSFTRVQAFGRGIVPPLNNLAGFPPGPPVAECAKAAAAFGAGKPNSSFVLPGGTFGEVKDASQTGPNLYQCCIHPWMHEVITVKP